MGLVTDQRICVSGWEGCHLRQGKGCGRMESPYSKGGVKRLNAFSESWAKRAVTMSYITVSANERGESRAIRYGCRGISPADVAANCQ